jgi:hypothetical protein
VPDEPTLGEVKRRVEAGFVDVKEDIKNLVEALDRRVSMERYQLEREALSKEIRELLERVRGIEESRRAEKLAREDKERKDADAKRQEEQRVADRRASDRRLIFTALVAPVLLLLLTVWLSAKGAGS